MYERHEHATGTDTEMARPRPARSSWSGTPAARPSPLAALLAALALVLACAPTYDGDPYTLCAAVDDITATAQALGTDDAGDLERIAQRYRRLAGAYRQAADELDDITARDEARHLAGVVEQAARDLEAVDDPSLTSAAEVPSAAIDEMGDIITSNPPIGLHDRAEEQVGDQCGPERTEP